MSASKTATNPLPSLVHATATDAANMQMRDAGRAKWSRKDFDKAAETQERLIRACYGYPSDGEGSKMCYLRFGIARALEQAGCFTVHSKMSEVYAAIDEALS